MRKPKMPKGFRFPKARKTDFTRSEMLDILDFYLQYKPMLEDREKYPEFDPWDFSILLYMYGIIDVNYPDNVMKINEKYENKHIEDLSKEKLDFLEIITVFTYIHRASRGDIDYDDYCMRSGVFHNLLCRMEEIRNELENE